MVPARLPLLLLALVAAFLAPLGAAPAHATEVRAAVVTVVEDDSISSCDGGPAVADAALRHRGGSAAAEAAAPTPDLGVSTRYALPPKAAPAPPPHQSPGQVDLAELGVLRI